MRMPSKARNICLPYPGKTKKYENKPICKQLMKHFISCMLIAVLRLQLFDNNDLHRKGCE